MPTVILFSIVAGIQHVHTTKWFRNRACDILPERNTMLTAIEPEHRQGRMRRPRRGSSPSKQILHCFSPLVLSAMNESLSY